MKDLNPKEMVMFLNELAATETGETRDKLIQVSIYLHTLNKIFGEWDAQSRQKT